MTDYGRRGGSSPNAGKRAAVYRCPHPVTREPVFKKRFKRDPENPVAVWIEQKGKWNLDAVIDVKDIARWVRRGYIAGDAFQVIDEG